MSTVEKIAAMQLTAKSATPESARTVAQGFVGSFMSVMLKDTFTETAEMNDENDFASNTFLEMLPEQIGAKLAESQSLKPLVDQVEKKIISLTPNLAQGPAGTSGSHVSANRHLVACQEGGMRQNEIQQGGSYVSGKTARAS